jgi:hypothetical protein
MEFKEKFFLSEYRSRSKIEFDGYIGYEDFENSLFRSNWTPIEFPDSDKNSIFSRIKRIYFAILKVINMPSNSIIAFVFPESSSIEKVFIKLLKYKKNITIICAVLDIDGIRTNDSALHQKEIKRLRKFKNFIVLNEAFEQWFIQNVKNANFSHLYFHDFFVTNNSKIPRLKSNTIVYAGNLAPQKTPFIYYLSEINNCTFNIYGPAATIKKWPNNTKYMGQLPASDINRYIVGSFGLIWDGNSIDNLEGPYGCYNRINTSHKLSLYITSGLPIIASKDAGIASLITKFEIGYLVQSLRDLPSLINNISEEDYEIKRTNLQQLSEKIISGYHTRSAINKIIDQLQIE